MHRDITPANIVLSRGGAACLVDFALATSIAEIRPEFTHHAEIAGTLAYLAPEQTWHTGRSVDQRADLYVLGATLYELATGGPPFGSGDPLRLTHDHLARVPVPPAEVNRAVPGPLSEIIMHLLENEPDKRYPTAEGLIYDLERLRDASARRGTITHGAGHFAAVDHLGHGRKQRSPNRRPELPASVDHSADQALLVVWHATARGHHRPECNTGGPEADKRHRCKHRAVAAAGGQAHQYQETECGRAAGQHQPPSHPDTGGKPSAERTGSEPNHFLGGHGQAGHQGRVVQHLSCGQTDRGLATAPAGGELFEDQGRAGRIWVQDGQVFTSAGVSAGIDLALGLVEKDAGDELAPGGRPITCRVPATAGWPVPVRTVHFAASAAVRYVASGHGRGRGQPWR
jgi:hypothetical protein